MPVAGKAPEETEGNENQDRVSRNGVIFEIPLTTGCKVGRGEHCYQAPVEEACRYVPYLNIHVEWVSPASWFIMVIFMAIILYEW